jgi:hypothetical protein
VGGRYGHPWMRGLVRIDLSGRYLRAFLRSFSFLVRIDKASTGLGGKVLGGEEGGGRAGASHGHRARSRSGFWRDQPARGWAHGWAATASCCVRWPCWLAARGLSRGAATSRFVYWLYKLVLLYAQYRGYLLYYMTLYDMI